MARTSVESRRNAKRTEWFFLSMKFCDIKRLSQQNRFQYERTKAMQFSNSLHNGHFPFFFLRTIFHWVASARVKAQIIRVFLSCCASKIALKQFIEIEKEFVHRTCTLKSIYKMKIWWDNHRMARFLRIFLASFNVWRVKEVDGYDTEEKIKKKTPKTRNGKKQHNFFSFDEDKDARSNCGIFLISKKGEHR